MVWCQNLIFIFYALSVGSILFIDNFFIYVSLLSTASSYTY